MYPNNALSAPCRRSLLRRAVLKPVGMRVEPAVVEEDEDDYDGGECDGGQAAERGGRKGRRGGGRSGRYARAARRADDEREEDEDFSVRTPEEEARLRRKAAVAMGRLHKKLFKEAARMGSSLARQGKLSRAGHGTAVGGEGDARRHQVT